MQARQHLTRARRVVIKVGTSSLTDRRSKLDPQKIKKLVREVVELRRVGKEALLVTSGAIGAGIGRLNLKRRPREMPMLQAAAAVGQSILMQFYEKFFSENGQRVAQMLLTRENFINPIRYKNFKNTSATLLRLGVIPIINENDTVAVEEIRFGDNDMLSAFVAAGVRADLLIMLSDVDGLCTGDPNKYGHAEIIKLVGRVTPEIEKLAGRASPKGFGGMVTKVRAAKMASESGIPVVIANGDESDVLKRVLAGEELGTIFLPRRK